MPVKTYTIPFDAIPGIDILGFENRIRASSIVPSLKAVSANGKQQACTFTFTYALSMEEFCTLYRIVTGKEPPERRALVASWRGQPASLEEVYRALNLEPLEDFAQRQLRKGGSPATGLVQESGVYRQIGSSTWMCVRILMDLIQGRNAIVVGRNMDMARWLRDLVLQFAEQLGLNVGDTTTRVCTVEGGKLYWESEQPDPAKKLVGRVGIRGIIYNDSEWAQALSRRVGGPFAMIRTIVRRSDTRYDAYADEGEFLMTLTRDGAYQAVRGNRAIKTDGFQVPDPFDPAVQVRPSPNSKGRNSQGTIVRKLNP